ncbi:MAG: NHLP bacteriocin export ABC transporter permease/ATPase subunit [Lachnospiraceae bacterium]|nr:NHLP bacteriocin export ABC transporter permease/ATPase subunit [Lachnospiraceae bacterium]
MSWFEEQIKLRTRSDDEMFTDAVARMVNIVSTEKIAVGMSKDGKLSGEAMEDILKYYHVKAQEIPEEITDMDDALEYLLRPSGLMRRPVKLTEGWHRDAVGAMLGSKKEGGIVAIIPGVAGGYYYRDYTTGESKRITAQVEKELDENAICFYRPFPLRSIDFKDVFMFMMGSLRPRDYVLIIAASLCSVLIGMAAPMITKYLYGTVLDDSSTILLIAAMITFTCAGLALNLLEVIKTLINTNVTTRISLEVESAMMMRVLSLPVNFFRDYSAGELAGRIGNVNAICNTVFNSILSIGLTAIFSLVYIFQVVKYAPALAAPALAITFATFIITTVTALWQMNITENQLRESNKEDGMVYALISGVAKLKNAGAEKRAFAKWSDQYSKAARYMYSPPLFLRLSTTFVLAVTLIGTIVMYYNAVKSGVSMPDYMAFTGAYGLMSGAFVALSSIAVIVAQIRPVHKLIKPVFDAAPEVDGTRPVVTNLKGGIELNNISFRYSDNMPNVLDNISLKIRPGQYVAIVGKTGCGKSTLMRILLGFEKPQKGAVYYDGKDISGIDLKSLRRHIGVVMQSSNLFQGDIYSNITISAPLATLDEAWEAAEMAGMADDIRNMPMGMNTIISEGQGGISGGQKQRLMIARAIAPKPRILMFDEATSALDNITQKKVSESLDSLKCTRIVIAHRLSTIRHCDRIIVLDGGKIIEDGTFDELIALNGFFANLVRRQM